MSMPSQKSSCPEYKHSIYNNNKNSAPVYRLGLQGREPVSLVPSLACLFQDGSCWFSGLVYFWLKQSEKKNDVNSRAVATGYCRWNFWIGGMVTTIRGYCLPWPDPLPHLLPSPLSSLCYFWRSAAQVTACAPQTFFVFPPCLLSQNIPLSFLSQCQNAGIRLCPAQAAISGLPRVYNCLWLKFK